MGSKKMTPTCVCGSCGQLNVGKPVTIPQQPRGTVTNATQNAKCGKCKSPILMGAIHRWA